MTPIHRLLIANRGEIARRIIRTTRRMGIETVAVYSDADAQALHVREATVSCALHGNASAETYLRVDRLIAAARATGADAIHPGYGFLSENAEFAQAVIDAGLTWVGPPPQAIRALGSKSRAKQVAQARGVPCLPGYHGEDQSDERLVAEAARIGFPVMVKAAAGGGGRGMRLVMESGQLRDALASARSEALSAFGSGELLLERALLSPRHVEVQVFADTHGHCIHLGERDCSVQRRHQKIIEESPSPAVDAQLREAMGRCAVELALAAGYVGAGTVEFLVEEGSLSSGGSPHPNPPPEGEGASQGKERTEAAAGARQRFYLMEMNTRLQVEHPVTEMVTGLDLVEWQLRVARGEPLPQTQDQVRFAGHAMEVRLCAEDDSFIPHAGRVQHFSPPPAREFLPPPLGEGWGGGSHSDTLPPPRSGEGWGGGAHPGTPLSQAVSSLRFDHAIFPGLDVPPFYDSMLGKLIAHAPTREQAIDRLAAALDTLQLLGLLTNRQFLAACLRHPVFRAGDASIPFLATHGDALRAGVVQVEESILGQAAASALLPTGTAAALPSPFPRPARVEHRGKQITIDLRASLLSRSDAASATHVVALHDGRLHAQHGATDIFLRDASFDPPASGSGSGGRRALRAPFNGKVIAVKAVPGSAVKKGETLLVIESMKLEHALAAAQDGVVKAVHVEAGQQAATSQLLVSFEAAP